MARLAWAGLWVWAVVACGDDASPGATVDGGVDGGPELDMDDDGFEVPADCDDADPSRNPGAEERCNGIDDDCDDLVDDADDVFTGGETFHADLDADGFGDVASPVVACAQPEGAVVDATDCNDADDGVFPGAPELCNGVDDDCDGLTDDADPDVVDRVLWYADVDGDAFGDAESTVESCVAPEGFVPVAMDCNDAEAAISPDAIEVCNGIDDDCDEETSEEGTAEWLDEGGTATDVTLAVTGTEDAPASYRVDSPGTLTFCRGRYYVNLETAADVVIRGGTEVAEDTLLDGAGEGPVVTVAEPGEVTIRDLSLTGGAGAALSGDTTTSGGGAILCEDGDRTTTLELENVEILENAAEEGGGLYADGCDVTATDAIFDANDATDGLGGGISFRDGSLTLTRVDVTENSATGGAAAILLTEVSATTSGVFRSVDVKRHASLVDVGDVAVIDASLSWFGGGGVVSGITESGSRANALYLDGATFGAVAIDLGRSGSFRENLGPDILVAGSGRIYKADDGATFECGAATCGDSVRYDTGGTDLVVRRNDLVIANVYRASSAATLDSFAILVELFGECDVTAFVLSSASAAPGRAVSWTEEWSAEVDWSGDLTYHETPYLGILTERNRFYALGLHMHCEGTDEPGVDLVYSLDDAETEAGFGRGVLDAFWLSRSYRTTLLSSSPPAVSPLAIAIDVTVL